MNTVGHPTHRPSMPNTEYEPIDCDTARSLYDLRLSHQLSSEYTILGDIPLLANTPSATQPLNPGPLTRVMTWNVGGGAGTLGSPDKLSMICHAMLCQGIQLACINEGHATKETIKAGLKELGLQHLFRAFGHGTQVVWLVQTALASRIVDQPPLESDRASCLVLAGPCHQRTILIGMYGYSSATEIRSSKRQQELWEHVEPFIRLNRERGHHVVVLGDLNVVPATHLSTSKNLLITTIQQFEDWCQHLGLANALLQRCPAATLSKGFFSPARSATREPNLHSSTTSLPPQASLVEPLFSSRLLLPAAAPGAITFRFSPILSLASTRRL